MGTGRRAHARTDQPPAAARHGRPQPTADPAPPSAQISYSEMQEVLKTLNRSASQADMRTLVGDDVTGLFTARGGTIDFAQFKQLLVSAAAARAAAPHLPPRRASLSPAAPTLLPHPRPPPPPPPPRLRLQYGNEGEAVKQSDLDLGEAFRLLDGKDNKGYIGVKELQAVCKRLGEDLDEQEVTDMVHEALIGFDGKIYYDGLLKILITQ